MPVFPFKIPVYDKHIKFGAAVKEEHFLLDVSCVRERERETESVCVFVCVFYPLTSGNPLSRICCVFNVLPGRR